MFDFVVKLATLVLLDMFLVLPSMASEKIDGFCADSPQQPPFFVGKKPENLNITGVFDGRCKSPRVNLDGDEHHPDLATEDDCPRKGVSEEMLYSTDSWSEEDVHCKRCDLNAKPDGTGIFLSCQDCLNVNSRFDYKKTRRDIIYMAYFVQIVNYTRPTNVIDLP